MRRGWIISAVNLGRGDIEFHDLHASLKDFRIRNRHLFPDYCNTGYKLGLSYQKMVTVNFQV